MKTRREFLQTSLGAGAAAFLPLAHEQHQPGTAGGGARPNIVFILADDLGFSDIGCYGSEIQTPHLDELAKNGLRFTDFHNSPRCCPSRAALLTGMYSHQAGMGLMTSDYKRYPHAAYAGDLSKECVTIAEALKAGGYTTLMTGKWHLTPMTVGQHNYPLQRGFDHYYGIINGSASYFNPASLTRDDTPMEVAKDDKNYYLTDAIGDESARFVEGAAQKGKPFFLYMAFTAGHWPLMAPEETIARYQDRYAVGWDAIRRERHAKQVSEGIVPKNWQLTPRDPRVPAWDRASFHDWEQRRMAVYAAQVDHLDQNVGKVVRKLRQLGLFENTIICFMSDNGGNFEEFNRIPDGQPIPALIPPKTKDGRDVHPGNDPSLMPGSADTFASYGIPWGNVSNTPFRLYKHYAHEGGIATPFIVHWPRGLKKKGITDAIGHEIDVMPTLLELTGVPYPQSSPAGVAPPPLEGKSLVPVFEGGRLEERSLFWEHEGNSAVREGKWKLVSRFPNSWELYDMEGDRTETHDLAECEPDRVKKMADDYAAWAKRVGVEHWPMPETPAGATHDGAMPSPEYLLKDRP